MLIEATPGLQSEALAAAGIPLINIVRQARGLFNASSLDIEAEHMVAGAFTEDYLEALKAFTEKRPGRYTGR